MEAVLEDEGLLFKVLDYCDHQDRCSCLFLSRTLASLLTSEASFKWRVERLHVERGVYAPTHRLDPPPGRTWRSVFEERWRRRNLWECTNKRRPTRRANPSSPSSLSRTAGAVERGRPGVARSKGGKSGGGGKGYGSVEFRIRVCARLKPRGLVGPRLGPTEDAASSSRGNKDIALPLHQRLALIRMNRNLSSQKEALEVLRDQGGWFGGLAEEEGGACNLCDDEADKWGEEHVMERDVIWLKGDGTSYPDVCHQTHVAKEYAKLAVDCAEATTKTAAVPPPSVRGGVHFVDKDSRRVVLVDPTKGLREFAFDAVDDGVSQSDLYDSTALSLVGDVIDGYNATCLVYGQTGSGKTHTMFGPPPRNVAFEGLSVRSASAPAPANARARLGLDGSNREETWGIIPRACAQIFDALEYRRRNLNVDIEASVSVSYVEVYGDDVLDLLKGGSKCGQSRVAAQRYVLDGSAEVPVSSLDDVFRLLDEGEAWKRKAATAMNDRSSRAHAIFIVALRQVCRASGVERASRLFLADLGGSEKAKKSQVLADRSNHSDMAAASDDVAIASAAAAARAERDKRLREAAHINLGLLALKRCVEALVARQRRGNRSHVHVPYSESKLTMLLSAGLGGDSKTCVVVCAAQEEEHGPETVAALRFGQICGGVTKVVTSGGKGASSDGKMLRDLLVRIDEAIGRCEDNIRKHERWETKRERRIDERAGGGCDEVEVVTTTVLVGAEKYRRELVELLQKRAELVGEPQKN